MTNDEFLKIMAKSGSKQRIIGIFILGVGILFAIGIVADPDDVGTGGRIFMGILVALCLLIGFVLIRKATQTASQIKNGRHPLINAIHGNDQTFVVWFYEHVTTVNHTQATADHQIWIYDRTNKNTIVSVKAARVPETLLYLSQKFPSAQVGYTEENRRLYKQKVA